MSNSPSGRRISAGLSVFALAAVMTAPALANPRLHATGVPAVIGAGPGVVENLQHLHTISTIGSTQDLANHDGNRYGLVQVPVSAGQVKANDFLVCNFNDGFNLQSLGTTTEEIGSVVPSKAIVWQAIIATPAAGPSRSADATSSYRLIPQTK